jgi:hypothetical protein
VETGRRAGTGCRIRYALCVNIRAIGPLNSRQQLTGSQIHLEHHPTLWGHPSDKDPRQNKGLERDPASTSSNGPSPLFSTKKPSPRPTISPARRRRAISARSVCHSHPLQELVEKARIVARVVDDVDAEGREFAVERHRRLRNEVSTPDHAKALVRISRGSGMRQERRALDAVPRRAPTCDPVGTASLAAHDRM